MATKRQKKLERKRKKRNEKRHEIKLVRHAGLAEQMQRAAFAPVYECLMATAVNTNGIGHVIFSRRLPDRRIAMAMFLVDVYCLGVKDGFGRILSSAEFADMKESIERQSGELQVIDAASARRLVEGAVAYAADLGLPPHADYRKLAPIFGDVDPAEGTDLCEFGREGKPMFISGPYDTPERCRRIVAALEKSCGPDGYHATVFAGSSNSDGERRFGAFTEDEYNKLERDFENLDDDDLEVYEEVETYEDE